jgi:outer membrane protein TolC
LPPGGAPAPPDLAALVAEAQDSSPSLRAAAARLEAVRRLPSQAEALPDPEISVSYVNDGLSSITLGDTEFSNLALGRSADIARAEIEVADKDLQRLKLEVASAVKTGYADLYRLDRTAVILEEIRTVLESLAQAARSRYEVGQGIQESVLKALTELVRLEAEQARVLHDRRAAEAALNAVVGRGAATPIGPVTALPEVPPPGDAEDLGEAAVAASPDIGRLEAAVRAAEAGLERARLDLKPDLIWSAAYQYRGSIDPMVMGMFGLRLPLYRKSKQAHAVLQADSTLVAARHDLADRRVRTRAMVRKLQSRAERAGRLIMLYEQGVIPHARGALESAQASYGVGRIAFIDLLNDVTVLLNARIELATQEADRLQALAALEPLVARELVPVTRHPEAQGESDAPDR